MCQSKQDGGLRCSSHMRRALEVAQAEALLSNSAEARRRVRQAQDDYDSTPQGIKDLQTQVADCHGRVDQQTLESLLERLATAEQSHEEAVETAARQKAGLQARPLSAKQKRLADIEANARAIEAPDENGGMHFIRSQHASQDTLNGRRAALNDLRSLGLQVNASGTREDVPRNIWNARGNSTFHVEGPNRRRDVQLVASSLLKQGFSVHIKRVRETGGWNDEYEVSYGAYSAFGNDIQEAGAINTISERLRALSENASLDVELAENVHTPPDVLARIHERCEQKNFAWNKQGDYVSVLYALASHPSAPTPVVNSLALSDKENIRKGVARSEHLSPETLVTLLGDESNDVRKAARANKHFADAARIYVASESGTFDPEAYASLRDLPNSYVVDMADTMLAD